MSTNHSKRKKDTQ